jgi:hypothetical protein
VIAVKYKYGKFGEAGEVLEELKIESQNKNKQL